VPPFAIFSATLTAVASGLYSLFQPDTSAAEWAGFQVINGIGRGAGIQMVRGDASLFVFIRSCLVLIIKLQPLVAIQHEVLPAELSTAMAFIIWCQNIGPAIFLVLYNVIFDSSLRPQILEHAPGVDADAVIAVGATKFRDIVSAQDLPGVLVAYANSLDRVFYLVAAVSVLTWVAAWGMGWKDIRKPKQGFSTFQK
jgi:hypothetical protein